MNKNEELVISYLSGEMSGEELLTFELQLSKSDELKKLVEEYSSVFNKVNEQKSVEGNYYYFENILQKFYSQKKADTKRGIFRSLAYASVIIIFLSASYIFFSNSQTNKMDDLEALTQQVSQNQLMELVDEYSLVDNSDLTSISSGSMLDQQINSFYDNSFKNVTDQLQLSDLTDQLSDSETNRIYSELLNKKIL